MKKQGTDDYLLTYKIFRPMRLVQRNTKKCVNSWMWKRRPISWDKVELMSNLKNYLVRRMVFLRVRKQYRMTMNSLRKMRRKE